MPLKTDKKMSTEGIPKSHPIVAASAGLTTPIGKLISDLIEPIARTKEDSAEAQSTEELMQAIEDTNRLNKQNRTSGLVVGSMDMVALYPSIHQ